MRSEEDKTDGLITLRQAKVQNLSFEQPGIKECPWCGKQLEPLGFPRKGQVFWVSRRQCGCEGEIEEKRRQEQQTKKDADAKTLEMLTRAGIKKRYLDARAASVELSDYLKDFATDQGRGLYLFGSIGCGKTYSASALAREFVIGGYTVVLSTSTEMLASIQETYRNDTSSIEVMNRYSRCDILLIDDLGKESSSSWSVNMLFQIVNTRYESMLPIVITSQYSMDSLEKRFSRQGESESAGAILSRLRQTCKEVHLRGPDRRQK